MRAIVSSPDELRHAAELSELDVADRGARVGRVHPRAGVPGREGAQPLPLAERELAHAVAAREPFAVEDPEAEAVERARLDAAHAGLLEPRRELGARVAIERGREDPLGGHAAAQQLADALDQHRRLPAARGRDDLQRAGARADGAQLLGVEAWDVVVRRGGLRGGPPDLTRRVQRALERVGVLEQRVHEVRRVQVRQLAVGLHEQLPAAAPHRLQDVAVQRGELVERTQPDAADRERGGDGDAAGAWRTRRSRSPRAVQGQPRWSRSGSAPSEGDRHGGRLGVVALPATCVWRRW